MIPRARHRLRLSFPHRSLGLPALLAAATLLLGGCLPPQADYKLGMSTSAISGDITLERPEEARERPLIILLRDHYKFVETAPGRTLTHPSVRVQTPNADGTFAVDWPADVVAVDVIFAAPRHLSETFAFHRTLGVGRIVYHARLRYMPDWRSHFYTFLLPQLQEFIAEPRYDLPVAQQQLLSDWLRAQQDRLEAERRARQSGTDDS